MRGWPVLLAAVSATPAAAQPALARRLGGIVREAERLGARTGVEVRVAGEVRFAHRAREGFVPASNMKLLTALLALETLGSKHRFETRFFLHARDRKQVLRVVSGGDPCLSSGRGGILPFFGGLAASLRRLGVARLDGFWLDTRAWVGPSRPAGWPRGQLQRHYAAPTGPFVLDEACFRVELEPGPRRSGPCPVRILPAGFRMPIRGSVTLTGSRRTSGRPKAWVAADGLRLGGQLRPGAATTRLTLVQPEPTEAWIQVLRADLHAAGIELGPRLEAPPGGDGKLVHVIASPIGWSLRRLLETSSNFQAEQLLRVVALRRTGHASLEAGRALLERRFRKLAPDRDEWTAADGSGLSRGNRASPHLLGAALAQVLASDYRRPFIESLPQSGVSGSLAARMRSIQGRVRAKTGWIRGASSLSGTVLARDGRVVIFSILMNYDRKRRGLNPRLKALQDRAVTALHDLR